MNRWLHATTVAFIVGGLVLMYLDRAPLWAYGFLFSTMGFAYGFASLPRVELTIDFGEEPTKAVDNEVTNL